MQPSRQAQLPGALEQPARLVGVEDSLLTEHVARGRNALFGDGRQLLVHDALQIGCGSAVAPAELGRDGVRTQERRHDLHGAFIAQLVGQPQQAQLVLRVESVARLDLDGRHAVAEHLGQPASAGRQQLLVRGRARLAHCLQDAAAGGEDLEISVAALAQLDLGLARPGEQQMGVRVDEPRRDESAARVKALQRRLPMPASASRRSTSASLPTATMRPS